jgi:hypothetical protein
MRRIRVLIVLIGLLAAAVPVSGEEYKGPRITVKDMRHDLGTVIQGAQASHIFEIRNTGTDTLVIEQVQTA